MRARGSVGANISLAAVAAILGCGGGDDDGGIVEPPTEQILPSCLDVDVTCPADPPEVGAAGAHRVDQFDIRFRSCPGEPSLASFADPISVLIPADTISFSVTVDGGAGLTGMAILSLGDTTYIDPDTFYSEPFYHTPLEAAASSAVFPIDHRTAPSGDSCLTVLPIGEAGLAGTGGRVHIVTQRAPTDGIIDLELVVVDGVDVSEDEILAAGRAAAEAFAGSGELSIGEISFHTTDAVPPSIDGVGEEIDALRALELGTSERAISVFFIADFLDDPGALGEAGGIPGPIGVRGTAASGVTLSIDAHRYDGEVDVQMLGETLAHEVGHQMGLFHTSESDGVEHDYLPDTPECPASRDSDDDGEVSAEECLDLGGDNMMFWIAGEGISQVALSPIQTSVLRSSPATR